MGTTRRFAVYRIAAVIPAIALLASTAMAQPAGGMMHPGMNPEAADQMTEYQRNYMGRGPGMGYMMGGGYGWGRGYEGGCGYGPGGGYMMGGPMMGRGMMGMGMMGGPMMGGPMMGGSMMGYLYGLDLTNEQRQKTRDLRKKQRRENLKLMTQMMDEWDKLEDLYSQDTPNPKEVGKVYASIFAIRRNMIENHLQERNSIYALLTDEQKKKLKSEEPYFGGRGMMMW